jgi:hypothetical protein
LLDVICIPISLLESYHPEKRSHFDPFYMPLGFLALGACAIYGVYGMGPHLQFHNGSLNVFICEWANLSKAFRPFTYTQKTKA